MMVGKRNWGYCCLVFAFYVMQLCFAQDNPCLNINNCGMCIRADPSCTWCIDNSTTQGTQQRCRTAAEHRGKCGTKFIVNPQSTAVDKVNEPFSIVDQEAFYNSTNVTVLQLQPQEVDLSLRPGLKQVVNITFRKVVDYPLDLYYVMDLSNSMKDDLEKLQDLGKSLVLDIQQRVTKNIQLGFGSFVDKVMMPYASTVPEQLINPCSTTDNNSSCAPVFGFRHQVSITSDELNFIEAVQSTNISGNIDSPEGGFDALMQIAVCQDIIKWRKEALHVILFTTDASPHIAMDGKLAAILEANDMKCHLEKGVHPYMKDAMVYSKSKFIDYPSVGQLKEAFNTYKIQTIFAVTDAVHNMYKDLPKLMDNSFVGILESDSSNVVGVISKSYDELKSKIQLSVPSHPDYVTMAYRVLCPQNPTTWIENTLECNNISIDDEVVFQFDFTANTCPSDTTKTDVVKVTSNSLKDEVKINIGYVCDCECAKNPIVNSPACNGFGNLQCGVCACHPGRLGRQCQCTPSTSEIPLEANCTEPGKSTAEPLCNGNGFCECGSCQCNEGYFNKFCQCKSTGCSLDSAGDLCGGIDRGECVNCNNQPTCQCKIADGWTLNSNTGICSCNNKTCKETIESQQCSGHGTCNCNKCECDKYYSGRYCQECIHPNCKDIDVTCAGAEVKNCAQCAYEADYVGQSVSEYCQNPCSSKFQVKVENPIPDCRFGCSDEKCKSCLSESDIPETETCPVTGKSECVGSYRAIWIDANTGYTLFVKKHDKENDCPKQTDPLLIVLPVVGGIVLIGLIALIIWKIYQTLRDKQEYESFMEETRQKKWTQGVNPIFSKASVRIENPAYMGGKY